jgi:hypothetical protein
MALLETLERIRSIAPRTENPNTPLSEHTELRPGKKGFLVVTNVRNPENSTSEDFIGEVPEGLGIMYLGLTPKRENSSDFFVWRKDQWEFDPTTIERFSLSKDRAIEDASTRHEALKKIKPKYRKILEMRCQDKIVLIPMRRPAIIALPAVNAPIGTSLTNRLERATASPVVRTSR